MGSISCSGMFHVVAYFYMALATVSECRESSGATFSNMILLADLTPRSALPLDCEYLADKSLCLTPHL